jgi:hypothetical protein
MSVKSNTYLEFWPRYLAEHARPATRHLHFLGTALGLSLIVLAALTASWWLVAAAVVSGYCFAWLAHAFVEHNRPATFTHPWWSLVSDFRMFFLWLAGRLDAELKRNETPAPE